MISALDAKTNTQTLHMYACVRDAKQAVTDLKRLPLPEDAQGRKSVAACVPRRISVVLQVVY